MIRKYQAPKTAAGCHSSCRIAAENGGAGEGIAKEKQRPPLQAKTIRCLNRPFVRHVKLGWDSSLKRLRNGVFACSEPSRTPALWRFLTGREGDPC